MSADAHHLAIDTQETSSSGIARFYVSNEGDVVSPGGYCGRLSRTLRLLVQEMSPEARRKFLPRLRVYLNMEMVEGEDWRFWLEGLEESWKRQDAFLTSKGHRIGVKRPIDGAQELSHPRAVSGNFDRIMLHHFHDALDAAGLTPANHTHLPFFADADIEQRMAYIQLMKQRKRRSDQIGRRLLAPKMKPTTSIPVNPMDCVAVLAADLRLAEAPEEIVDINHALRINGKRPFSILTANAYGWVLKDCSNKVACRNKGRKLKLVSRFIMTPTMAAAVRTRFAQERSPLCESRTLLEEIERLASVLWGPDAQQAAEAEAFLSSVAIFKRPSAVSSVDGFLSYEGLRYWTNKGRRLRNAQGGHRVVQFSDGRREPNLRDYRRASITKQILELYARTSNEAEREAGREKIARMHDQSHDQSKAYAAFAYAEEEERRAEAQFASEAAAGEVLGHQLPPAMHHLRDEVLKDEFAFLATLGEARS